MYKKGLSNKDIYNNVVEMGFVKEQIIADSSEPKSIDELKYYGIRRIQGAKKGKDSVNNGIQWIQDLEIIIHPRCVNFLTEISNYQWDTDKFGNIITVHNAFIVSMFEFCGKEFVIEEVDEDGNYKLKNAFCWSFIACWLERTQHYVEFFDEE